MFRRILPTVIAVVAGLFTLLGALMQIPLLVQLKGIFVNWAMVVGSFAMLVAFLHLLRVNAGRLGKLQSGWDMSALVLLAAVATFSAVLLFGTDSPAILSLVNDFWIPGESALLALTAVTLILSGMRMLRTRRDFNTFLFLGVAVFLLIGVYPPFQLWGVLASWVQRVPAMAGMRGILLGVTLGVLMTGARILLGIDRPHSDE